MIRHTQQIGGVTVNYSIGRLDDMPRCASCGRALCGCTDDQFKGASVKPAPDWFASIPSFGRDWPAGVLSVHKEHS